VSHWRCACPFVLLFYRQKTAYEMGQCLEFRRALFRPVADRIPLMHGVYAHGPLDAAQIARQAEAGGASCLLVFPPAVFARGAAKIGRASCRGRVDIAVGGVPLKGKMPDGRRGVTSRGE